MRWRRDPSIDDRGMVTAFVTITAVTLLLVAGMVFEGGRILSAKRETLNVAESAARAGAQALDEEAVRRGDTDILDHDAAVTRACSFLGQTGHSCGGDASVQTAANRVTVSVTDSVHIVMLPGVEIADPEFTMHGEACVARGITGDEPTAQIGRAHV